MSKKLHLIGNAHIDPVWLWQWTEGYHEVKATFRSALDRMNESPDFTFSASSAAFYEWVEGSDPQMFAEIQQRVAEGRWELTGGWWIEPDCNIPGGELFARQALLAQSYFREKFGRQARVGYAPDSFGHNAGLPQILKLSALDSYIFMRPGPHEKSLPGRLFWWQGADGSRVAAHQILFTYATWGDDLAPHVERCAAELNAPVEELMCFYGVGNHGGGPTRANIASLHRLQDRSDLPGLVFSSPERYFAAVTAQNWDLPVVTGELQHHASGCYAAHSGIKRWNRRSENMLLAAEKWAAVGQVAAGQAYPGEELRWAWKNVLFNQFHDILAGTSLEAAYEDARSQLGEAQSIAGRALNRAAQALGWQVAIPEQPGSHPLIAFNPHAWASLANLELEVRGISPAVTLLAPDGQAIPCQWVQPQAAAGGCSRISFSAELPPLGYAVFRLVENDTPAVFPEIQASDTVLENEHLRLEINPESGAISSLRDKQRDIEVFRGEGARAEVIEDTSDTWSHNVFRFDQVVGGFQPVSARLVEQGPVKAVIRVISTYAESTLIQEFSLYAHQAQVAVKVTVDWHEHFKLLKLRFPVNVDQSATTAEVPYGVMFRRASGEEEACQNWVDVSGSLGAGGQAYGLSLLNDGKYSYDVNGSEIGLTVLRSPIYAHHMPVSPEPEGFYSFIDQGVQHFHYSLLPHSGGWQEAGTVRRAAELNQPAWLQAATCHPGRLPMQDSFMAVQPENLVVSAFKLAEDGQGWIVRAYESAGRATAGRVDLPVLERSIEADWGAFEVKTFYLVRDAAQPAQEVNFLEIDPQLAAIDGANHGRI